jgi:hypothetical protein
MTREESACCRQMQGNCGDMAKMGCCRTESHSDQNPQLATHAPSIDQPLTTRGLIPSLAPVFRDASTALHGREQLRFAINFSLCGIRS